MNTKAYDDGYTQITMQAGLYGIEEAQAYFHATHKTVFTRYLDRDDAIECGQQWFDGGLSALLDFHK